MLNISIITLFPDLFHSFINTSIIKRAIDKGLINFNLFNMLDTVEPKVRVDAHTVGPGPGMVIKPEVIEKSIKMCQERFGIGYKIFFTPQGEVLNQTILRSIVAEITSAKETLEFSEDKIKNKDQHVILVCGRYEGFDARAEELFANKRLSIGDYVLMGGELPAQVFIEGFTRLLPEVLGNADSIKTESFETPFFDAPQYCKPNEWNDLEIPAILQTGDHAKIEAWRKNTAAKNTLASRFDWVRKHPEATKNKELILSLIPKHYVVIMHDEVLLKDGVVGQTSIKSMDLHDISRAAETFGFVKFFVVQPLKDQQSIAKEFFSFWTEGAGTTYNKTRCQAVSGIEILNSLEEVLEKISQENGGKSALIISTSAKSYPGKEIISFHDQGKVWKREQPVLIVLGTGHGLAMSIIDRSDYILAPIYGLSNYNHLSVRSAAAIIFDRWLGLL